MIFHTGEFTRGDTVYPAVVFAETSIDGDGIAADIIIDTCYEKELQGKKTKSFISAEDLFPIVSGFLSDCTRIFGYQNMLELKEDLDTALCKAQTTAPTVDNHTPVYIASLAGETDSVRAKVKWTASFSALSIPAEGLEDKIIALLFATRESTVQHGGPLLTLSLSGFDKAGREFTYRLDKSIPSIHVSSPTGPNEGEEQV